MSCHSGGLGQVLQLIAMVLLSMMDGCESFWGFGKKKEEPVEPPAPDPVVEEPEIETIETALPHLGMEKLKVSQPLLHRCFPGFREMKFRPAC